MNHEKQGKYFNMFCCLNIFPFPEFKQLCLDLFYKAKLSLPVYMLFANLSE